MSHVESFSVILWTLLGVLSLNVETKGQPQNSKTKSEIIHVGPPAQGASTTLQSAIDTAPEYAVIRIAPGTYEGPLRITKPVTLEGAGWMQTKLTNRWHDFQQLVEGPAPISPDTHKNPDTLLWWIVCETWVVI